MRSKQALNLRVGEVVQVRSKEEIFATLDENGSLDHLPFMPEMLRYCGKQFKVYKTAHKTCDTLTKSGSRRMQNTVHLEEIRCGGESHGGCEAGCLVFWKEAWLERVHAKGKGVRIFTHTTSSVGTRTLIQRCTEFDVVRATRTSAKSDPLTSDVFSCQATELLRATSVLPWWDVTQYVRDLVSGNVGLWEFIRVIAIAAFNAIQRFRRGSGYPSFPRSPLQKTPTESLNLKPGEFVWVKSKDEIVASLDRRGKNRGLWFDAEMLRYCGGEFKVLRRVKKIIDEKTGEMRHLPNDCIVLDGVTCRAHLSRERLFCPRSITPYWREIWLKRPQRDPIQSVSRDAQ